MIPGLGRIAGLDARSQRFLGLATVAVLLVNGALFGFLVVAPGGSSRVVSVDNLAMMVGPLLTIPLCLGWLDWIWRRGSAQSRGTLPRSQRWAAIVIGLGALADALGAGHLHHQTLTPSWVDATFLSMYPLLFLGIVLLARSSLPRPAQTRVVLDGLMTMTAAITLSWYFVLGPVLLKEGESGLGKLTTAGYPLGDLLLIAGLVVLSLRIDDTGPRPMTVALVAGLGSIIFADSIYSHQTLQGTYLTGKIVDVGWPLGVMLICLAIGFLRVVSGQQVNTDAEQGAAVPAPVSRQRSLAWGALLPYALVPLLGVLLVYVTRFESDTRLETGVIAGCAVLLALMLLRQIMAVLENWELYNRHQTDHGALTEATRRLEALATTDPLTDLLNHGSLIAALDRELERSKRFKRPFSVLYVNLDHFKALNDGFGHAAGDAALRELGSVTRGALRGIDVVGRLGGEEFVIILPETGTQGALSAAEHVRAAIASHVISICGEIRLTCSLGLASYPQDAEDRDSLIELANRAMYAAKRLGRNQVRMADDPAVSALNNVIGKSGSREEAALLGTVEALAALVDARDRYTGQHTTEVSRLSMRLAMALGVDASQAHLIGLAARLHDIGKVSVPDAVLQKPGPLTANEWAVIRQHPITGAHVVSRVPSLRLLVPAIRGHHERWDGFGYPDELVMGDIPLGARVLSVADAYGAMTTDRPYRAQCTPEEAVAELRRCAGTQFDPKVVATLERVLALDRIVASQQQAV